jgi:predicted kinase
MGMDYNKIPMAIITVGIPGSGKTTWAKKNPEYRDINLDMCRKAVSGSEDNQACTPDALKLQASLIADAILARQDVIISNTNLIPAHRADLITTFSQAGYNVVLAIFDIPFEVCQDRNLKRDRVVPKHAMVRMQDTFDNYPPKACARDYGIATMTIKA